MHPLLSPSKTPHHPSELLSQPFACTVAHCVRRPAVSKALEVSRGPNCGTAPSVEPQNVGWGVMEKKQSVARVRGTVYAFWRARLQEVPRTGIWLRGL